MCRVWEWYLRDHPDAAYRDYIIQGLQQGFRVGFQYGRCHCTGASANMQSAVRQPEVIDEYLAREVRLGRVMGPLEPGRYPEVHINRFWLVPKNHQPGKWRLVVDLSHPWGASVNDGLEPELCSIRYTSVDVAVGRVLALGQGSLLAKFDVEGTYRIVPVHPEHRWLLGMKRRDGLYVDKVLPFGHRSAPKIYSAVWILREAGVEAIHCLDDFLHTGALGSSQCEQSLHRALALCETLGVPVASHKTEGPTSCLVFLGIELDPQQRIVRLLDIKLRRLQKEIRKWESKKACISLIDQLQHACCVVRPGRSFLRRMIDLSKGVRELHHKVRLNRGFRSDLRWWACFLPAWNGKSMMTGMIKGRPQVVMTSDASGSWGCGAYLSSGKWFQLRFLAAGAAYTSPSKSCS